MAEEIKLYTWNDKNREYWNNDKFSTIEECVENALKNGMKNNDVIFVGEVLPYEVNVNASALLEELECNAYDECGDIANSWDISVDNIDELDDELTKVVRKWLEKTNQLPTFYNIINVGPVVIKT